MTLSWIGEAATVHHVPVRFVGDGEEMRWHLITPAADVHLTHGLRVDRKTFVRVDDDAEQARVGLQGIYYS